MRRIVWSVSVLLALLPLPQLVQSQPQHVWSRAIGGDAQMEVHDIAVDASGNILVTGGFFGTLFTEAPTVVSDANGDPYVMSLDPSGLVSWVRRFPATNQTLLRRLATDGDGNVVLIGSTPGTIDFGGGPLTSAGGSDICLAKLDSDGNHLWSKRFGEADTQEGNDVVVDSDGSVVIYGRMKGRFSFGGPDVGLCPASWQCTDGEDVFLARFAPDGTHVWSREFGSLGRQAPRGLAMNSSGDIFVTGGYDGATFDAGGGPLPAPQPWNGFVIGVSSTGEHLWSKGFGIDDWVQVGAIGIDPSGNPLIGGYFRGLVTFGGDVLECPGGEYGFIACLDAGDGSHHWSHSLPGSCFHNVSGIAVDGAARTYVTGNFCADIELGGTTHTNDGFWNPYLATITSDGTFESSVTYTGVQNIFSYGAAVDAGGNLVMAGVFDNQANFGGSTLTNPLSQEMWVAKFTTAPVPVLITEFSATPRANTVEIAWKLWSDEAMESFSLYRGEAAGTMREIASGPVSSLASSYRDLDVRPGATYRYSLVVRSTGGDEIQSQTATATVPALVTALGPSTPNPLRSTTEIEYSLAERTPVSIGIYDVRGARVARLEQGTREPGAYRVTWDGKDHSGQAVASGVYFYRMEGQRAIDAKKLIVVR